MGKIALQDMTKEQLELEEVNIRKSVHGLHSRLCDIDTELHRRKFKKRRRGVRRKPVIVNCPRTSFWKWPLID